jgi:plasmid stabilization system protein ParE
VTQHLLALRSEAEDDIRQAVAWYAERSKYAASRLVHELDAAYERILENPLQSPVVTQDVRRALLERFPYGVYYVELAMSVEVIAVLHLMRYPETWRLRDR